MNERYAESYIQDIRKDPLREPAIGLVGEFRSMYYSHMRRNLSTVVGGMVMNDNQDLRDLQVLQLMKGRANEQGS